MIEEELKLYFYKLIKFNANVDPLLELGYDYIDISKKLRGLIDDGDVVVLDGVLSLTAQGKEKMDHLEKGIKKSNQEKWIEPEYQSRIKKLKKDEVFVPELEDLWKFR